MKLAAYFRSVGAKFFHRSQMNAETDDELRSHIEHRADDLERSGISRAEAERRARVEFGGQARYKEEIHEAAGGTFVESLLQDLRFAIRMLRKSPGFAVVAMATLAMAIGANTVVFSVMNSMVLRPLNLPREESLYLIERGSDNSLSQSYPNYLDLRDRNHTFESLAAFNFAFSTIDTGNNPSSAPTYEVSGNYFDALDVQPYVGTFFHGSDEHGPNSAPYIVLSHAYWHSHFQEDRGVVGRTVLLNKHPFTIVGVAPPGFHGTLLIYFPDFFVPMVNKEQIDGVSELDARGTRTTSMTLGHLKPGVTPEQAVADLNSIGSYLEKTYPKDDGLMSFKLARPSLAGDLLGPPAKAFLAGLMTLAGLILLAACANLGSLFAARAADRSREVALRLALGASRMRILRQLFTESILISAMGGAIGLWASAGLLKWLSAWRPIPGYAIHLAVNPDGRVYAVALVLALASGFLFGAAPMRQILRTDAYQVIKSGTTDGVGRRVTVRDLLLAVQIAICAVLVTSSMVAVRGLVSTLRGSFGFQPRNAILADTDLHLGGYSHDKVPAMQKQMIEAVRAVPGVQSVGLVDAALLRDCCAIEAVFTDDATDLKPTKAAAEAISYDVSPEYFQAAGTDLLFGREFSWHDDENAPRVAIVNRLFASKVFGSSTKAVGAHFKMRDGTRAQVVGVVQDGKYKTLTEDPQPALFLPILQSPSSQTCLVVRSIRDPAELTAAIRNALQALDPGLSFHIETWNNAMNLTLFPARVATETLGVMGVIGAMLSITGIFGMAAYSVSKRKKELGIRIALGAQRTEVLQAALGRAVKLLAFGSAAGLLLGILVSRVLASIVYSATPRDPLVLVGVVLAMMLVGLVATWIPAQRALALDPLALLRED